MSAFVVSYNHINAIVHWAVLNKHIDLTEDPTPNKLGQILWDENVISYNYRYYEKGEAELFTYNPNKARLLTPIAILKALNCLEYQSCEHPEWKESIAYYWVSTLRRCAIYKLPGYDEADCWDID